jgi:chromosome partitioning protein
LDSERQDQRRCADSAVNSAAALVKKGKKVILVDLDQQASATRYLGLDHEASPNMYEVFMGIKPAALAVRTTKAGVDIISSNGLMAAIEEALEPGDELKALDLLTPLTGKAMLAFNALAADLILIAASAERAAVDGIADLISHVQGIM